MPASTPAPTQPSARSATTTVRSAASADLTSTLWRDKLTILALTHFGPEQATRVLVAASAFNANGTGASSTTCWSPGRRPRQLDLRDRVQLGPGRFRRVSGKAVNGFGAAQYASYALTETLSLNGRAEVWRDDNNFFVASFPGQQSDFVRFQQGLSTPFVHAAPGTQHDLRRTDPRRDLEAGDACTGDRPAGPAGNPLGSRLHRQQALQRQPTANSKGTNNSFTFGADVVLTF